jgi:hypothetical protein
MTPLPRFLQRFLPEKHQSPETPGEDTVRLAVKAEAQTFVKAAGVPEHPETLSAAGEALDAYLEAERKKAAPPGTPPEGLLSPAAAWLGEAVRGRHGGHWREHPVFGLVLEQPGNFRNFIFLPLQTVLKKWELRGDLSIARFLENLEQRFQAEERLVAYHNHTGRTAKEYVRLLSGAADRGEAVLVAKTEAQQFQRFWKERFGADLALSLTGVREAERFLRSQFFLITLRYETFVQMGFFVGEAARGLFEGQWDFREAAAENDPARAALAWPELSYYPVGRVLRLLTEQPETETLDEYIRLIPSARNELRKQAGGDQEAR